MAPFRSPTINADIPLMKGTVSPVTNAIVRYTIPYKYKRIPTTTNAITIVFFM